MKGIQRLLLSAFSLTCASACADAPPPQTTPVMRGLDLEHTTVPPSYNFPAALNNHNWDFFLDASFIYWHVSEEFLQVGIDYKVTKYVERVTAEDVNSPLIFESGTLFGPTFAYRPGFKVGFGIDTPFDDWSIRSEWTRISEEVTTHYHAGVLGGVNDTASWDDLWISVEPPIPESTKWSFLLNLFDLSLERPFYQGKRLIVSPLMGLRGMTLKQSTKYKTTAKELESPNALLLDYKSHLWGIGPKMGARLEWLLYKEFRLIGSGAGSLLYTRYTSNKLTVDQSPALPVSVVTPNQYSPVAPVQIPQFSALRSNAELCLGLGWGTYFPHEKYHIDFTATYDFQAFFKMNVMSAISNSWVGDIYLHGLTVGGRFDF